MGNDKRPSWALRECETRGCSNYASDQCEAWDKERGAVCGRPLCEWHRYGLQLPFCRDHRHGAGKRPTKPTPLEETAWMF